MEEQTNTDINNDSINDSTRVDRVHRGRCPITLRLKGVQWEVKTSYEELEISLDIESSEISGLKGQVVKALIEKAFGSKREKTE